MDYTPRLDYVDHDGTDPVPPEAEVGAVDLLRIETGVAAAATELATKETPAGAQAKAEASRDRGTHTGFQAVSTVTNLQTILDGKAPIASPTFTGTPTGITKAHVGLGNVDNTADSAKPVSTAQQTALNLKQDRLTSAPTGAELASSDLVVFVQGGTVVTRTLADLVAFVPPSAPEGPVAPAVPTGLSVVAVSPTQVDVVWNPVGAATYDIRRNGEIIATGRAGTSFPDTTGIVAATTYTYEVQARENGLVSGWSEARSVTTPTAGVVGTAVTDTFTRADASTLGSSYTEFTAAKFGIVDGKAAPLAATATLAAHVTPTATTRQYAELSMDTLPGASSFIGPAVRVPNTIGTAIGNTDAFYIFAVTGSTSNGMSIRRKEAQSSAQTVVGSGIVRQYVAGEVLRLEVEGTDTPVLRGYVNDVLVVTAQDTSGLQPPASQQRCGVFASGTPTAARLDNFEFGDIGASGEPPATIPPVPLDFTVTALSPSRIDGAWSEVVGATFYEYRRNGGTPVSTGSTAFSDAGLVASTLYSYEVRSGNGAGVSAWSAAGAATTQAAPVSAPAVPTGASAVAVSSTAVNYGWVAVDGATSYEVERNGVVRTGLTATFVNDTGLTPSTAYAYRVRARNSAGVSAYTALSTATTPAADTGTGNAYMIGLTAAQIQALPTTGAAWTNVLAQADKTIVPNLTDFSSKEPSHAFAAALVYVRTGDASYRTKVVAALEAIRTTTSFYYSAVYRQMAGWVIAADLVGHRTPEFVSFISQLRNRQLPGNSRFGRSMFDASWDAPNNHGAHARGAYTACSIFVGDATGIANAAKFVQGWLGDRAKWTTFQSGSFNAGGFSPTDLPYTLTWAENTWDAGTTWSGINPTTAMAGRTVAPQKEGAVVMDVEREATSYSVDGSGNPVWGGSGEQYSWGAMVGTLTAMMLLSNLPAYGAAVWGWSDKAGVRWLNYLKRYGSTYSHSSGGWVPHFLNKKYTLAERANTTFTGAVGDSYGYGFTDWLMP